jgi:peptide deformylase
MVLTVVKYGDPVLRRKGMRIDRISPEISQLVTDMLETMESASGVGLAAQQVGWALQLTVIDVRDVTDRPSTLWISDEPASVEDFMPLVLINPVVEPAAGPVSGAEGCLSFPEIYADIERPELVNVTALDAKGRLLKFRCGGLLARAIQHEVDHLNGILFIDRMTATQKGQLRSELDELQLETKESLKNKPSNAAVLKR